ncbi:Ppx/GppA phosphatase [Plectosphaerella plurivora]|uniref:Ppx/GppA phosphatase n=1 Tax=Plectosphaerella plurivora TaxID=936078 RepID=A0A9P8VDU9_9PEZI|nr:Ppx/GppA phosphatase [Plectosphaerella plurivora]
MSTPPAAHVVTLDNFESLLPRWDSASSNHLFALVDMGSNGIRFSISDLSPPQTRLLRCVYRERSGISLFDALGASTTPDNASGSLADRPLLFPPETITQVAETLARFRRIADSYGVPTSQFSVLATEAMRRADNAGLMLTAIREAADIGVHVLAPPVETLFGAVMGSRSSFVAVPRGGLFLDLGGGSVQMTWVDTTLPDYEIAAALAGESMPFGAARLIRVLEQESAEVRTLETSKLRSSMQAAFAKLCAVFSTLRDACQSDHGIDVYLCGGGFRGYGSMLMHNDTIKPFPISSVGTYSVSGDFFKQTDKMRRTNVETKDKIYGLSSRRRQQFPAIVEVVQSFIEAVPNIRTATFCAGSNRDGALLMKLPRPMRESNPLDVLGGLTGPDTPIAEAVLGTLLKAIPSSFDLSRTPTIVSLGLGPLFAKQIWAHPGEDDDANASYSLNEAITRDPGAPGLTHLTRAVLATAMCSRWGANLGPIDSALHENLKALVKKADRHAVFWAEYFGAVAGILVDLMPVWPKSAESASRMVKFEATKDQTKKGKDRINLTVLVSKDAGHGVNEDDITERLHRVGKVTGEKREIKVKAQLQELEM